MDLMLRLGETIEMKGHALTVSDLDLVALPAIRDGLITIAKTGATVTYGSLKVQCDLPHAVNGMGRLLDLLSEDCTRRQEPSLAAVVVSATTGEVGDDFDGDPVAERRDLYSFWA